MKGIYIMDENLKIIRTYENDDSYISGTEFYESKIIIKRVTYDENNNLVDITDERLLSNTESDSTKAKLYTGILRKDRRNYILFLLSKVLLKHHGRMGSMYFRQIPQYILTMNLILLLNIIMYILMADFII